MYSRYAIVRETDLREGLAKVVDVAKTTPRTLRVEARAWLGHALGTNGTPSETQDEVPQVVGRVEARGIEPRSENGSTTASTCVVRH
jgi:hypothetical protein